MDWRSELPIPIASKLLPRSERNCFQIEEEGLPDFTVWKNHQYVYGQNFTIQTDHAELLHTLETSEKVKNYLLQETIIPNVIQEVQNEWPNKIPEQFKP